VLKLENISKYYFTENNVVLALRRINIDFNIGEFIAITGESGSGKSTLLNILSGLDTWQEGKVYFRDEDISHYSVEELEHYRKNYIGYVHQDYNIINGFTVYENIELALILQGYDKNKIHNRVMELIDLVDLSHVTNQKASKISGGEKQRTVIARTLAKDYQILVCDEPTENLNTEASEEIFELLKKISKTKLVIAVTHDLSLVNKYATRKIHLYDGEIMEDSIIESSPIIEDYQEPTDIKTNLISMLRIALKNILSVPKNSLLALFTMFFILTMVLFIYTVGNNEINKPFETYNPFFRNSHSSRIILIKDDQSKFTEDEINEILSISSVRGVYPNDVVFDSSFVTKVYDEELGEFRFYQYKPLSSLSLDDENLTEGRLPINKNEVVLSDNGLYEIGDVIGFANNHLMNLKQDIKLDQYVFTVVGFTESPFDYMFLTNDGLDKIVESSLFENSDVALRVLGTEKFDIAQDMWITPDMDNTVEIGMRTYMIAYPIWVTIDNTLEDDEILTFNMMYFEICRNFGYKKEITDDMDAGLCNVDSFVETHEITFKATTEFGNNRAYLPITLSSTSYTSEDQSLKLYMNQTTYDKFFNESHYQITTIVKDAYTGKKVVSELEKLGYNVFYPSQLVNEEQASAILLKNLATISISGLIIFIIFFIGYFVMKNIIFGKQKEYLIIRSLGTEKRAVKQILRFEISMISLISIVLLLTIMTIIISKFYSSYHFFQYYTFFDYLALFILSVIVIEIMVNKFTKTIFDTSVISALKGVE
jgi:ABC-type lipoprotein export system ATPase subunit